MSDHQATTIEKQTLTGPASDGAPMPMVHALRRVFPPGPDGDRFLDHAPLVVGRSPGPDGWQLDDGEVSRRHAAFEHDPASGGHRVRDLGSRNGTRLGGLPVTSAPLSHGDVVRIGRTLFVYAATPLPPGSALPRLTPRCSLARAAVEARVRLLAQAPLPVLIVGETGAGKERLAREVHTRSGRSGPFVPVNCGALSGPLLASELFGHVRGAFSGADRARSGLVTSADKGTLFLDEIGELPLAQQPTLLRVLQERKVRPVGADRAVPVDVRVVSATHVDLKAAVAQGRFRQDLLARLDGVMLHLPPLRARRDAIVALFAHFVGERPLDIRVAEALLRYDWPQNVRELEHVATQVGFLAAQAERIELGHLPPRLQQSPTAPPPPSAAPRPGPDAAVAASTPPPAARAAPRRRVRRPPRAELEALLERYAGNLTHVAEHMGVQRNQIYRWLDKLGIDRARFRGG